MMPPQSQTTAVDSANLILKLYELRREPVMREARNYIFGFNPTTIDEYFAGMAGEHGAYVRMVVSYWEMACALVTNGAIDPKMFDETQGEHIFIFSKIEPLLEEVRSRVGPNAFKNLEHVCVNAPGGIERVRNTAARMRAMASQRA
jgi:hypothetical protein